MTARPTTLGSPSLRVAAVVAAVTSACSVQSLPLPEGDLGQALDFAPDVGTIEVGDFSMQVAADTAMLSDLAKPDLAWTADCGIQGTDGAVPIPFSGPFHLPSSGQEINFQLRDDGTFIWEIFGCDFSGGDVAVWSAAGMQVVVTPQQGKNSFNWVDNLSFKNPVDKVLLTAGPNDGVVTATAFHGGMQSVEEWYRGRVCADCGGGLGPKDVVPCCKPL